MEYLQANDIFVRVPRQQTLTAWKPLWDCITILFEFQNSDIDDGEDELPEWRLSWVAGVVLLRTIGHVLAKVDSRRSIRHKKAIDIFWEELKSDKGGNAIFWEFIDKERNSILKSYSFGASFTKKNQIASILLADGSDAFQRFRTAVYWWRAQLEHIEVAILEDYVSDIE